MSLIFGKTRKAFLLLKFFPYPFSASVVGQLTLPFAYAAIVRLSRLCPALPYSSSFSSALCLFGSSYMYMYLPYVCGRSLFHAASYSFSECLVIVKGLLCKSLHSILSIVIEPASASASASASLRISS